MLIESRPALDPELAALITGAGRIFEPEHDVAYLVGFVNGRAVACGAWQAREPGVAELRRLYVRPAFRGRGLARQMIVALEEEALAAGRPLLRSEFDAGLSAAVDLYRSAGYRQAPSGPYRVRFVKRLPALIR